MTFLNACRNGQKGIVQIFLKKGGIDVNKRDAEGNTPLYYACQKGYRDIVSLLLDNEAIRLLDNRRTDAALFLIEQGADTEIADNTGHKAIDYATAHGLRDVLERLSAEGTTDAHGNTPLHQAAFNGQSEIVRSLLSVFPDMTDAANDEGETPLIIACMKGNLAVTKLLLDAGADANRGLLNGNSPLHFAAWSGNKFIGSDLIAAHAQVNAQNGNGETPLILAAREGNNEFVLLLVVHGADVNLADNLQHTALYYAGERGYSEITEILLTAGAEG